MKISMLYAPVAGIALLLTGGCDNGVKTAPTSTPSADTGNAVKVDIDAGSTAAEGQEARSERREERRENLREKIDKVDVQVDGDGVKVDVE